VMGFEFISAEIILFGSVVVSDLIAAASSTFSDTLLVCVLSEHEEVPRQKIKTTRILLNMPKLKKKRLKQLYFSL
jgi:hypothetical protein